MSDEELKDLNELQLQLGAIENVNESQLDFLKGVMGHLVRLKEQSDAAEVKTKEAETEIAKLRKERKATKASRAEYVEVKRHDPAPGLTDKLKGRLLGLVDATAVDPDRTGSGPTGGSSPAVPVGPIREFIWPNRFGVKNV